MTSSQPPSSGHQKDFFDDLANPQNLLNLFEFLPQVYMYVKDRDGYYIRANRVAREVMGIASEKELAGKNDFDFFPPAIAAQYVAEDRHVLDSGKTLRDQVWLVPGYAGVPQWYLCNKIPLWNRKGEIHGIAGVKRPYEHTSKAPSGYGRLLKVVEYVSAHYSEPLEVVDLAEHARLSVSQLQREFARLFSISPSHYIREVRIGVARHLLQTSDRKMAEIAEECGFYDQSHFTRQFKATTGMTPLEYRQRYHESFQGDDKPD